MNAHALLDSLAEDLDHELSSMEPASTFDRLKAIIHRDLHGDPERITPSASFRDDLGADSLESVGLVVAIEQEFDVEISDDEADGIETVGDALAVIERKVSAT
jgi:acyl carrier protein